MFLLSLVGLPSLFWSFRPHHSRFNLTAALLASFMFVFNSLYFIENATLMAETAAIAWALLSLTLAWLSHRQHPAWLFLSGIAFGLSLSLKFFVVFIPLLIGLLLISHPTRFRLAALFILGSLTPIAFFSLIYPPLTMYQEVVVFRFALRQATLAQGEGSLTENIIILNQYFRTHGLWLLVALLGAGLTWRKRPQWVTIWGLWFGLSLCLLLNHVPLRNRYALLFLPPMAVFASLALTHLLQRLFHLIQAQFSRHLAERVIISFLSFGLMAGLFWPLQQAYKFFFITPNDYIYGEVSSTEQGIIDLARQYTLPQDCIVIDDQRVAMVVPRLVPPFLSETSSARHLTQFITTSTVMEQINHYDCPMVIYWDGRFMKYLPDLAAQLRDHYFLEITYNDHLVVYLAQKQPTTPPTTPLSAEFSDLLHLQGFTLSPEPWQSGQTLPLATYWQATTRPDIGYKFLLQLQQVDGPTIINFDQFPLNPPSADYQFKRGPYYLLPTLDLTTLPQAQLADYPAHGMLPTNAWPLNQILRIVSPLHLPPDLPPGHYQLYLGLYAPDTMTRLPITTSQGQTDKLLLLTMEIKSKE